MKFLHLPSHTIILLITAVDIEKCRQNMKQQACTSNDRPNQILTFSTATARDEVKARLPQPDSQESVSRARAQHRPKDPSSLQELTIPNHWSQTVGTNPTQFLHYDNGPEAEERVIIFSTDGTFSVAPRLFHQLYVIQGQIDNVFLPLAYVLLQHKTQTTYEIRLHVLEQAGCDPSVIIVDFERSVELAIVSVFGEHVNIQYCFYHLTQYIWRKIQSLGLTTLYENDNDFRLFCGQIDALAFLP